jgi:hypothetical protein
MAGGEWCVFVGYTGGQYNGEKENSNSAVTIVFMIFHEVKLRTWVYIFFS